jgi:integrase/recombinase XerD
MKRVNLTSQVNQLKAQFIADMELAGLAAGSRRAYLDAVEQLVRYYWCSPAELTQDQLQDYILDRHKSNPAKGTFKVMQYSLRLLFTNTLGRDWQLFKKK